MAARPILLVLCVVLSILALTVVVEGAPRNRRHLEAILSGVLGTRYGYGNPNDGSYGGYGAEYSEYSPGEEGYYGYAGDYDRQFASSAPITIEIEAK
ncbi:uncharacterized protein LOC130690352 [Daphnia carinata]|uniref:uncharacterized protein LOC130690352 n=1 Tax=Daphnia carinata TaxID=120202 RepID=UPI00257BFD6A|nr:uncharacterized protein LOC130690352 [Daphnia carinata]